MYRRHSLHKTTPILLTSRTRNARGAKHDAENPGSTKPGASRCRCRYFRSHQQPRPNRDLQGSLSRGRSFLAFAQGCHQPRHDVFKHVGWCTGFGSRRSVLLGVACLRRQSAHCSRSTNVAQRLHGTVANASAGRRAGCAASGPCGPDRCSRWRRRITGKSPSLSRHRFRPGQFSSQCRNSRSPCGRREPSALAPSPRSTSPRSRLALALSRKSAPARTERSTSRAPIRFPCLLDRRS